MGRPYNKIVVMFANFLYENSSVGGPPARQREAARDGRPTNTSHFSSFVVSVRK